MQKFSKKFKTSASAIALLVVVFGVYGLRKLQVLAADPVGEKDCRPAADSAEQAEAISIGSRRLRRSRA